MKKISTQDDLAQITDDHFDQEMAYFDEIKERPPNLDFEKDGRGNWWWYFTEGNCIAAIKREIELKRTYSFKEMTKS